MDHHDSTLRQAFRQVVLTLAGVFSVYEADDDLVWAVARGLDRVFRAHLRAPAGVPACTERIAPRVRPYPAVVELLASLDPLVRARRTP